MKAFRSCISCGKKPDFGASECSVVDDKFGTKKVFDKDCRLC